MLLGSIKWVRGTPKGLVTGPILESKGMRAIFQKKGKKSAKKGKIFENFSENVENFKIFWKRALSSVRLLHAWNS